MSQRISPDLIFGTLDIDAKRAAATIAERAGISHRHRLDPPDPLPDQPVTLTVTIGPQITADRVSCYVSLGDTIPSGRCGVADVGATHIACTCVGQIWDTLVWGYVQEWRCTLPPQPEGTFVRYTFEAWSSLSGQSWHYTELVGMLPGDGHVHGVPSPGDALLYAIGAPFHLDFMRGRRTLAYHVDTFTPPQWLRDAVIYHIFVDRFSPGQGRPFVATTSPMEISGGTLRGVIENLEYIASLGATVIWLSPIFPSPSHHGYDTTDFRSIEPRLGTMADVDELIAHAHGRGIRVLFDLTANHCSEYHPAFVAAQSDPHNPYRDWFVFTHYPDRYLSFFGVPSLPQFDHDRREVRQAIIADACFWLQKGVDGFRLDYTIGPSHAFWSEFAVACRTVKPDCALIGEAVDTADTLFTYAGRLDGCLDFLMAQALRETFAFGSMDLAQLDAFLQRHLASTPDNYVQPTFLDNHDMNRFLWSAGGNTAHLKLAALCQYTLPSPPILYYGTEVGLSQASDVRHEDGSGHPEESRLPMLWGDAQDGELLAWYRQLGRMRHNFLHLIRCERQTVLLHPTQGLIAWRMGNADEWLLVVINCGSQAATYQPSERCAVIAGSGEYRLEADVVHIGAYSGAILCKKDRSMLQ